MRRFLKKYTGFPIKIEFVSFFCFFFSSSLFLEKLPGCCQTVATSSLKLPNILTVLNIFLDCMTFVDGEKQTTKNSGERQLKEEKVFKKR